MADRGFSGRWEIDGAFWFGAMVLMTVGYFQAVTRGELRKIFSKEVSLDRDPIDYIRHEAEGQILTSLDSTCKLDNQPTHHHCALCTIHAGQLMDTKGVVGCTSLQRLVCSGEFPASLAHKVRRALPWTGLHNLYGPTEAAIDVTAWNCPADFDGSVIPIGRPIANTRVYLLDGHGAPVPFGGGG